MLSLSSKTTMTIGGISAAFAVAIDDVAARLAPSFRVRCAEQRHSLLGQTSTCSDGALLLLSQRQALKTVRRFCEIAARYSVQSSISGDTREALLFKSPSTRNPTLCQCTQSIVFDIPPLSRF